VPDVAPLPERARLFHVGIPKSGTTSLQMAASNSRDELRRHGVLYPGKAMNQRLAVLSFMGRRWGWTAEGIPGQKHWDRLMTEMEEEPRRRIWFGHEFASEANEEMAKRFADEIGPSCHVVVTLRSPGAILPSAWQQYVKAGVPIPFDEWLEAVIADPPNRKVTKGFHDRNNQSLVVRRWAGAVGADRVTVIVLDKKRPELLFNSFEQLLGLPINMLKAPEIGGFASNRGLTVPEVELFVGLNKVIRPHEVEWPEFERMVRNGALRRIMDSRKADEPKPQLPHWAVDRASELGTVYAKEIAETGVQVIGDLDLLSEKVPARPAGQELPSDIPISLAVEAMAGMLSAGSWRGAFFDEKDATSAERERIMRKAAIDKAAQRLSMADVARFGWRYVSIRFNRLRLRVERMFGR
jgi:hypothetical protein